MSEKERIMNLVKENILSLEEAIELLELSAEEPITVLTAEPNENSLYEEESDAGPNIFDGLSKLSEKDLKYQIATLETMTLKNIFGEQGQKAAHHLSNAYNYARNIFKAESIGSISVVSMEERINRRVLEMAHLNHTQLKILLKDVLANKVNTVRQTLGQDYTYQELSNEIIELASLNFKNEIDSDLTISQKADQITILYFQKLQKQLSQQLLKQNSEERRQTEQSIQSELNKMSSKQSQELQKALNVQDLSGETVRNALTSGGGGALTLLAINGAGFGAYIALSTILHAVFTTTLGITLPFAAYTSAASFLSFFTGPAGWLILGGAQVIALRKNKNKLTYELLAQVVFLSVQTHGNFFDETSKTDLPDYMPDMERDEKISRDKVIYQLESEINNKEDALNQATEKLSNLRKDLDEANMVREISQKEKEIIEEALKNKAGHSTEYIEELKIKNQILEETIAQKNIDIDTYDEILLEEGEKIQDLNNELSNLKKEREEEKEKNIENEKENTYINERLKKSASNLEKRWNTLYEEIEFGPRVFKEVVKEFSEIETAYIERTLLEMVAADDPRSLPSNRGKMHSSGLEHIAFYNGSPGRIFYRINPNNSNQSIYIDQITKHNDSRYGKR